MSRPPGSRHAARFPLFRSDQNTSMLLPCLTVFARSSDAFFHCAGAPFFCAFYFGSRAIPACLVTEPLHCASLLHPACQVQRRLPRLRGRFVFLLPAQATHMFSFLPLRANYLLRMLPLGVTADFARGHDDTVQGCLSTLLGQAPDLPLPEQAQRTLHLPLRFGGLGLRSAVATAPAAYWASWADWLAPRRSLRGCCKICRRMGLKLLPPSRRPNRLRPTFAGKVMVCRTGSPRRSKPRHRSSGNLGSRYTGGSDLLPQPAMSALELHLSHLDAASRALLLSQAGPHAARALTIFSTSTELAVASPQFRVILLRRLRLALPVAPRACACRGRLDPLGDHRAACANAGVLASRALPLERAVARVCQEAGARVARNVRLADMSIDVPVSDDRRIEVVANGLPLWHGSQQAIDATIVSPVT